MVDTEHGEIVLSFSWRGKNVVLKASFNGYAAALLKEWTTPPRSARRQVRKDPTPAQVDRANAQARASICSVVRDWAKTQLVVIESGVMNFDAAFLPHMLTRSGERVIDVAQSQKLLGAAPEADEARA